MRALRRDAGLDQTRLAELSGIEQSRISKIETGRLTPTRATLERLTDALGLASDARTELLEDLAQLETEFASFRVLHRRGQRLNQARYAAHDAAAATVSNYAMAIVPGLLQTPEYALAMLAKLNPQVPSPEELVAARIQRQQVLYDRTKRFSFLIAEAVLTTPIASAPVMRAQVDRIATLATGLDHILIGVVPLGAVPERIGMTSFTIRDAVVFVELDLSEVTVRDTRDVEWYMEKYEGLRRSAVTGREAVDLLRRIERGHGGG